MQHIYSSCFLIFRNYLHLSPCLYYPFTPLSFCKSWLCLKTLFRQKNEVINCYKERRPGTEPCAMIPECSVSFSAHTENSTPAPFASLKPRKRTVGFSRSKVAGNKAEVSALYFVRCLPLRSHQNVELIIKLQPPSPREGLHPSLTLHS